MSPPPPPPGASPYFPPALPEIPVHGQVMPCLARGCSACCHDTEMLLTDADVARITPLRPGLDYWFLADDGHRQLHTRDGPPAAGGHGKPCIFLDDAGTCSIHVHRPEGCRLYPAVWDGDVARATLDPEHCPHTDGFRLPHATRDAVRRLAERLMAERDARSGNDGL
jgi:Fe-S-cluster containining protein